MMGNMPEDIIWVDGLQSRESGMMIVMGATGAFWLVLLGGGVFSWLVGFLYNRFNR